MLLFGFFISGKKHDSTDTEEIPTWVGGWDLRIALFIGLTLGSIHGIASFFIAYIVGSIIGIYLLIRGWATHTEHQIAFGPFLWIGWLWAIVFHAQILVAFSLYFSNNI
jgi:prepilin signal peptidase PulO-like enzyme (type II secretory pathway)